jgi:hypothetical protein
MPLRIDHHGWQLAFLALGDRRPRRPEARARRSDARARDRAVAGDRAGAADLSGDRGAAMVLFWVDDRGERGGCGLCGDAGGGTALGFLLFASYANRQAVCDACRRCGCPTRCSAARCCSACRLSPADWKRRLALRRGGGVRCRGCSTRSCGRTACQRLEGVSPEVERAVAEPRARGAAGLPPRLADRDADRGAADHRADRLGAAGLARRARPRPASPHAARCARRPCRALLLLWQTRTGPAAQMLGCRRRRAGLGPRCRWFRARVRGSCGCSGLLVVDRRRLGAHRPADRWIYRARAKKPTPREAAIGKANRLCNSLAALRPIAQQPKGMVFTFVDTGPRLITVTHHNAITGPYHRNGEQIGDVMKAFRGSAEQARAIVKKVPRGLSADLPEQLDTTIFMSKRRRASTAQLQQAGRCRPG